MKGNLRAFDADKSLLCNVGPSPSMIPLTSKALAVEWEGLLVDAGRNDLHLGSTDDVRYNLAVFRDV
jgi:hypothetical protein